MKLGFLLGYSGKHIHIPLDLIKAAESMGYDSVWTAEAYGNDAVTAAAWVLANTDKIRAGTAIMQMPARTPAMCAMTAMSLDQLSGGRFIVGLGASGPQVVEGWHGQPYGKPLGKTREYVSILRTILARAEAARWRGDGQATLPAGQPAEGAVVGAQVPHGPEEFESDHGSGNRDLRDVAAGARRQGVGAPVVPVETTGGRGQDGPGRVAPADLELHGQDAVGDRPLVDLVQGGLEGGEVDLPQVAPQLLAAVHGEGAPGDVVPGGAAADVAADPEAGQADIGVEPAEARPEGGAGRAGLEEGGVVEQTVGDEEKHGDHLGDGVHVRVDATGQQPQRSGRQAHANPASTHSRDSAVPSQETATNGFYQKSLPGNVTAQLLRVWIPTAGGFYAEISGGKHRFSIRFMDCADWQHPTQVEFPVSFSLSICMI